MIDFVLNALHARFHKACNETVQFYEERLEAVWLARQKLMRQLDGYEKRIVDLVEMRIRDRIKFESLAKSRNKYRRKYVIHHIEAKKRQAVVDAALAMFRAPTLTTADSLKKSLQPFCKHNGQIVTAANGKLRCTICDFIMNPTLVQITKKA